MVVKLQTLCKATARKEPDLNPNKVQRYLNFLEKNKSGTSRTGLDQRECLSEATSGNKFGLGRDILC